MQLAKFQKSYEYGEACAQAHALQLWWRSINPKTNEPNISIGDWVYLQGGKRYPFPRAPDFKHNDANAAAQLGFITGKVVIASSTLPDGDRWKYDFHGDVGGHWSQKPLIELVAGIDHFIWVPRFEQLLDLSGIDLQWPHLFGLDGAQIHLQLLEKVDDYAKIGQLDRLLEESRV